MGFPGVILRDDSSRSPYGVEISPTLASEDEFFPPLCEPQLNAGIVAAGKECEQGLAHSEVYREKRATRNPIVTLPKLLQGVASTFRRIVDQRNW